MKSKRFKKIYIEISNVCNLQCSFCPEVEREKKFMGPELFGRVVKEAAPLTDEVCFHLMGEPLAHPHFTDYLEMCAVEKVPVNLTTNGTLLQGSLVGSCLLPIVRQINISVQSFEANFPTADISKYLEKIFDFVARALVERPDLYVNLRLWNWNEVRRSAAKQTPANEKIISEIRRRFKREFEPTADVRRQKGVGIVGRFSLHFDTQFRWPNPKDEERSTTGFCHGLSSHVGILADGTVVPCCLDKEGVIALGKCGGVEPGQGLDAALSAPRAALMADGFKKGILTEDLCRKCTFIKRFDKKAARLSQSRVNATDVVVGLQLL